MKRKTFVKSSAALMAGTLFSPLISCKEHKNTMRKNWAGNYTYQATNLHEPNNVAEIQELLKKSDNYKALGSTHCFNNIADSPSNQISTKNLNRLLEINTQNNTVTVEAGMRYGELAPLLDEKGYALHNLASLPHISVAGACATATHGSGVNNGNLSTAVEGFEMVKDNGTLVNLSPQDPDFYGAVVGLGALGILTKVTLGIQPTFQVKQNIYQDLPLESLKNHFQEIMAAGYSVSLFTDWQDEKISQVWIKRQEDLSSVDLPDEYYGAKAATRDLHPITALSAENCTSQMGIPGPWYDRLPHFKMGFTPSSGEELQSEYFVPRLEAVNAILALEKKKDLIFPQLLISEIRTIAADNFWLSPCYQRDCVAIHFTWKQNWQEVSKILPVIESELSPFNVLPHWGKLFTISPEIIHSRYKKFNHFIDLTQRYDPESKFKNNFLALNIYGEKAV